MSRPEATPTQDALLAGEVMAVAYSGFREGQHPDRGSGAVNPRQEEILEDLRILAANGFRLIRLYDSGENSRTARRWLPRSTSWACTPTRTWEEKSSDEGLAYTIENIDGVRAALPGSRIAILEAGWATTATEFGARASEENQKRYYREVLDWATVTNMTVFFFEAFDEPWKGNPDDPRGAEKHWGLFFVDRAPKAVMRDRGSAGCC